MSWWWRKLIGKKAEQKAKADALEKQIEAAKKLRREQTRRLTPAPRTTRSTTSASTYHTSDRRDYRDTSSDLVGDLATVALAAAVFSSSDDSSTSWSPSDSSSSSDSWSGGGGDSGGGGADGSW